MADVDAMSVEEHMEIVAPLDEPTTVGAEPTTVGEHMEIVAPLDEPMTVGASDIVPASRAEPSPIACCPNEFKNGDASSFGRCAVM